jgi:adenylate cyclase
MSRLRKAAVLGLVMGIAGVLLSFVRFAGDLEEGLGLHMLFKLRGTRQPPSDVLVISMDRTSADAFNFPEDPRKWSRTLHARLVEMLAKQGAAVIAFDIIFDENHFPREDKAFSEAIEKARNVVLCRYLKSDKVFVSDHVKTNAGEITLIKYVRPIPILEKAASATASFPLPKVPVKLSQYWTFKRDAGDIPTMPVVAFQVYSMRVYDDFIRLLRKAGPQYALKLPPDRNTVMEEKSVERVVKSLRDMFENDDALADKIIYEIGHTDDAALDAEKRQMLLALVRLYNGPNSPYLNFYGPAGSIRTISYHQALHSLPRDISGKAVFIGLSELFRPEQKDGFNTVYSGPSGVDISGVEIAATAFANILENRPVKPVPPIERTITLFLWGMIIGTLCVMLPALYSAVSIAGLGIIYLSFAEYQFKTSGIWYPAVIPLFFQAIPVYFGTVLWKYMEANRERSSIRKAFEYYLPDSVIERLVKNLGDIKVGGQTVYGTCLYTDAKQYTKMAEQMEPEELGDFMNRYYATLFEPVRRHGGIVSNVIGDSMMALWISSKPESTIETMACLAALDIDKAIHTLNRSSETMTLPTRISIHSGRLFMGNIGAMDHYEYRPIGDIVNTTTRIEGLHRFLGTRILVSKDVISKLTLFQTRNLGTFLLAGKSKPIVIHELVSTIGEATERQKRACGFFSEALDLFNSRQWRRGRESFQEYVRTFGDDEPSAFYTKLCAAYEKDPPADLWNGEIHVEKEI